MPNSLLPNNLFGPFTYRSPILFGEKTELRLPCRQDYSHWLALRNASKAELVPFEPSWGLINKKVFAGKARQTKVLAKQDQAYQFLIFSKENSALLGGITLGNIRYGAAQTGEIGYWLGTKYYGQGYMRDAVSTVLAFAFSTLRLHRIEAACIQENQRSIALLKHCGFHHEGFARAYLEINGRRQDHHLFARLQNDATPI